MICEGVSLCGTRTLACVMCSLQPRSSSLLSEHVSLGSVGKGTTRAQGKGPARAQGKSPPTGCVGWGGSATEDINQSPPLAISLQRFRALLDSSQVYFYSIPSNLASRLAGRPPAICQPPLAVVRRPRQRSSATRWPPAAAGSPLAPKARPPPAGRHCSLITI